MTLLSYLPAIAVLLLTLLIIFNVFVASIYDIKQLRRKKKINSVARRKQIQPVVAVIIICRNHQETVIDTVQSILKGGVKKLHITIVDNVSSDNSKKVIRSYIKQYPEQKIRFVARRKYEHMLAHNLRIISKYTYGELTYVIKANQQIHSGGLKILRNYFVSDESLQFIEPLHKPTFEPVVTSIHRLIYAMYYERARKLMNAKWVEVSESSYMFRSGSAANNTFNIVYTNKVTVLDRLPRSSKSLQLFNPLQLIFDWIVLLLMLTSIATATPVLFLIGWLAVSIDFIVMLLNSTVPNRERGRLAVYVPLMYLHNLFSALRRTYVILKNIRTNYSSIAAKP